MNSFTLLSIVVCLIAAVNCASYGGGGGGAGGYGAAAPAAAPAPSYSAPAAAPAAAPAPAPAPAPAAYSPPAPVSIPAPPCPKNYLFSCQPRLTQAPCSQLGGGYGGAGAYSQNYPVYALPQYGYQNY